MRGLICIDDFSHEMVDLIQKVVGPTVKSSVIRVDKSSSSRRFIYLTEIVRKSIDLSCDHLVIVCTNWVKELADSSENFLAAARAIDRVMLRFGAVNIITSSTLQKALLKCETLQAPRPDVIVWTGSHTPRVAIERMTALRHSQFPEALDPRLKNLSGHIRARAVLVGEEINRYLDFEHWPFFDDRDAASYISLALEKSNVLESDLMWTNIIHPTEANLIQALMVWKPTLKIIAMGNVAHEGLRKLGLTPIRRVSHPAWVRRFKHNQIDHYSEVLDRAIRD